MISLLLATFFSGSFGLVVRYAQRRNGNLFAVGAINYATAAIVYGLSFLWTGSSGPSRPTIIIGVLGGLAYVIAYFFLCPSMRRRGVPAPTAVMRLAVLVPMAFSLFLWNEYPNGIQSVGVFLAILSLPMLGANPEGRSRGIDRRTFALMVGLFFTSGGCMLSMKSFHEVGPPEERLAFLFLLFLSASAVAVAVWAMRWEGSSKRDILPGIALGMCNIFSNFAMLSALRALPGVIVFPFFSAVGLAFTTLFAVIVWGEHLGRKGTMGIAIAVLAAVFINVG